MRKRVYIETTIPSFYYAYATDKEIKMPPESEEFGGSYPVEPKGDKDLEEDIEWIIFIE